MFKRKGFFAHPVVQTGTIVLVLAGISAVVVLTKAKNQIRLQELQLAHATEKLRAEQAMAAAEVARAQAEASREATKIHIVWGLATAATTALLFLSDVRTKQNIRYMRRSARGVKIYRYSYCWDPTQEYEGVMAQDLLQSNIYKHAVYTLPCGHYAVDYSSIDVELKIIREGGGGRGSYVETVSSDCNSAS
mmetsp:Transcript_4330/g.15824  ORF Transcript_4330/g.15824 Transcript_4330/m.15824 type:complete len:191 (-) Transcript_4330:81-653(-)